MGHSSENPDKVVSTLPELPLEALSGPPGVVEAVQLYESAASYYAAAMGAETYGAEVVASASTNSPW